MLTHLHIRNFAIIENLELDFKPSFTAITGETGAGKSIIIDALGLVLGDRGDASFIRHTADQADITALFDLSKNPSAKKWLAENELQNTEDDECHCRRILRKDGRSRHTINGQPCTQQQVRDLGQRLMDIHSQHEHHSLLQTAHQRKLLDTYGQHLELCENVKKSYEQWREASEELEKLIASQGDNAYKALMRYQLDELTALNLKENEIQSLDQEHKQLANADELIQACHTVLNTLKNNDEINILSLLHHSQQALLKQKEKDHRLNNTFSLLETALIQIEEACGELDHFQEKTNLNPERLAEVESRLSILQSVARKHKVSLSELPQHIKKLEEECKRLESSEERLTQLEKLISQLTAQYQAAADKLSAARQKANVKLSKSIQAYLKQLHMKDASFSVKFLEATQKISPHGQEQIQFYVSTNPGQPSGPLQKIASGGELSRLSLAIQVATAELITPPTIIFDEVDVGIGGATAEIVGKLLQTLSKNAQVIVITHQPQVASQGKHHLQVKKDKGKTDLIYLDGNDRTQEIARMLGGVKITQNTLKHAEEMLNEEIA